MSVLLDRLITQLDTLVPFLALSQDDVYKLLKEELAGSLHALALHLYSPDEWAVSEQEIQKSPNCMGKNT